MKYIFFYGLHEYHLYFYNLPLSASAHAGRESSKKVTSVDVCARKKRGVLRGAVRKNTSCSRLPFGAAFARSTPQCLQLAGTPATLCFDEGFRASKSEFVVPELQEKYTFPSVLLRRQQTWRVTRAPAGRTRENSVFAVS